VVVLLIGGGITVKIYQDRKREKIEAEAKAVEKAKAAETAKIEQLKKNAREAEEIAARAQIDAEQAMRKAAQSKSKKDLDYAKQKEKDAESAKQTAQETRVDADKKIAAANEQTKKALDQAKKAEEGEATANEKAKKALAKAKADSIARIKVEKDANKTIELTANFYANFSKLESAGYKNVCKRLYNTDKDAKNRIEEEFKKADNQIKEQINKAVHEELSTQQGAIKTVTATFNTNVAKLNANGFKDVYAKAFNGISSPSGIANAKKDLEARFKSADNAGKIEIASIVEEIVKTQKNDTPATPIQPDSTSNKTINNK
jgi:hypothetical protein